MNIRATIASDNTNDKREGFRIGRRSVTINEHGKDRVRELSSCMIMKAAARLFEQASRFHRLYPSFLDAIIIVQPETVIRWHRRGFRAYPLEEQPLATSANVLKVVGSVVP
jgi:hypothetical protein